ncbi:amidohydrolase [Salegentibacter sp. JZCK2]|uniref:amidohydrolase n=1 Tax=Salegentibacter tibetensis TaxID=2873600 RepID=UPI001CCD456A|nr:amidohydrolase [Salegentibacter tibetensis]MBZ9730193.1 amidohydrolase [Salegentibacter tibetensis]
MSIEKIKSLRKELHRYPELSGEEIETAGRIKKFIEKHHTTKIIENIEGNGLAAIYEFSDSGPTIVIRCELDALPIEEVNDFEHRSLIQGISHKCGHDGHMAIVAGLIFWLKEQDFKHGKVVLLFQPAEETGTGAPDVLNDNRFRELNPDYIVALHNIPRQPLHSIIIRSGNFSSTVQSVAIQLKGKESHSAEPEHGVNPALCIAELIQKFDTLNINDSAKEDFRLCVPIYSSMGVKSYGISAGFGEIHYTLRTRSVAKMKRLMQNVDSILLEVCSKYKLPYTAKWFDYFPAVVNDDFCNQVILATAKTCDYDIIEKSTPFKFGEDFGWYSEKYKAAMFGIGAGLQSPALHQTNYDFPDEIIETGMTMFKGIIERILTYR